MSALANQGLEIVTPDAPPPLGDEAFHGILGEYVIANDLFTESDLAAVLLQSYVLAGNAIGRPPHIYADGSRHGTNENVLVVGLTNAGRKGTSYANARLPFAAADSNWAEKRIQGGLSSGEGLIHAIRDPTATDLGVEDKRLCVVETEFAGVLKVMERKGSTVSELIRQAWDGQGLNILSKNNPAHCTSPHVSLIAHSTPSDLKFLGATDVTNGFLNRFLVCYATRSKVLPEGGRMSDEKFQSLTAGISSAIAFAKRAGVIQRDQAARELWDQVYVDLTSSHPGVFGSLTARAAAHIMRLSMICALMDKSYWIRSQHLLCALAIWRYCEDSIRFIFGDSLGDRVSDQILSALRASPTGVTRTAIFDVVFRRNQTAAKIESALRTLEKLKMARCESTSPPAGKGRPTEVWFADSRRTK